jgi:putative membrane protein
MQWWCSAQTAAWDWSWQPYPGVWAFIVLLAVAYRIVRRRSGAHAGASTPSERRLRTASFVAGLLSLWVALDWPLGALGAGYLASAHMMQFLLIGLVAPPLLLYGLPTAAYRPLRRRASVLRLLRLLTHPLVALASFNVIVVVTHWPTIVDGLMTSQLGSFFLDMAWLTAGLVLWWPIAAPVPERAGFSYLYRVGYLILATILNTPVFILLTFSELPLYATFELAPPVHGISAQADQQVAGLLMKIGGGLILWTGITILFFRWYRSEQAEETADRELGRS